MKIICFFLHLPFLSLCSEKLYAKNNYQAINNVVTPANLDDLEDCITNQKISLTMLTVESHDIYHDTMLEDIHDPFQYRYLYELYFHQPGVRCRISGAYLKVYNHASLGGIGIHGNLYRLSKDEKVPNGATDVWTPDGVIKPEKKRLCEISQT